MPVCHRLKTMVTRCSANGNDGHAMLREWWSRVAQGSSVKSESMLLTRWSGDDHLRVRWWSHGDQEETIDHFGDKYDSQEMIKDEMLVTWCLRTRVYGHVIVTSVFFRVLAISWLSRNHHQYCDKDPECRVTNMFDSQAMVTRACDHHVSSIFPTVTPFIIAKIWTS